MTQTKPMWTVLMLLLNILATIFIVFRLGAHFVLELSIVSAFILIAFISISGFIARKRWGISLMSLFWAIVLLNLLFLYFVLGVRGNMYNVAFLSALIGVMIAMSTKENKKSPAPKIVDIKPVKTVEATTTVKKKRKKKTKKKKTKRKKSSAKKKIARKKTKKTKNK